MISVTLPVVLPIVFSVTIFLWSTRTLAAREIRYKDYAFELREGDRLVVADMRGSVKLIPSGRPLLKSIGSSDGAATKNATMNALVRVRKVMPDKVAGGSDVFEQWSFTVRRDENVVHLEAKGPDARADWEAQLKNGFPELQFEIEAPSVPAEVVLREGVVSAQGWKNSLYIQVLEGQVRLAKNEGTLRLQVQKGEARVDGHKGRVEFDGFNPKLRLDSVDGDVTLANFSGESSVNKLKGNLQMKAYSGQTVVTEADGGLDFDVGRGSLSVQGLDGSLRGQLDNGSVSAKLVGDPEVNIEAQEGSVSLRVDSQAGASVRLQTEEGVLRAPDELPTSKTSTHKLVTGRLKGAGKGSIFVKTKSGTVVLR